MKKPTLLAFDVGGTDIKAAIVTDPNRTGLLTELLRVPTPRDKDRPAEVILDALADLSDHYRKNHPGLEFVGAGLVVPGIVDEKSGVGVYSANLGWRNFPFAARAQELLKMPVAFGHDVTAAGLAEFRLHPASAQDALLLVIGTGIAAALSSDGRAIRSRGYAGELGHAAVPDPDNPGGTTILESVASAAAVARRYSELCGRAAKGAREVVELAARGDPSARKVWDDCLDALAFSVGQTAAILAPEVVIIGGGLAQAGDQLFKPLEQKVANTPGILCVPSFTPAKLGTEAGLVGASILATKSLLKSGSHTAP